MRNVFLLLLVVATLPLAGGAHLLPPHATTHDPAPEGTTDPFVLSARTLNLPGVAAGPGTIAAAGLPPLPGGLVDVSDADLVLLLAHHAGLAIERPHLRAPPPDADVSTLVLHLAHRSGATQATPADVAAFATLDPRVAAPVLTLLLAIDQAWDLRDAAVADLPPDDARLLAQLTLDGQHETPHALQLAEPVNRTQLVQAAILLLDAAEALVIPQLQDAADAGAWPADPIADPLGILRIGGTGDDLETMDRLLQIDPRGNDAYRNNAGGTTLLADLDPTTPDYPIALSIDLHGHDDYRFTPMRYAMGSGFLGVGIQLDLNGDDHYECPRFCQGAGTTGVGVLRDYAGDDKHLAGDESLGYGDLLGIARDDDGDDRYAVGAAGGGYGFSPIGHGLLWDRAGVDAYKSTLRLIAWVYGWGDGGGHGWFVDEGWPQDDYETERLGGLACNDCRWSQGHAAVATSTAGGQGNDNRGGLAALLTEQGVA